MRDEASKAIAVRLQDLLAEGAIAVFVTLIEAPKGVGAKMIVEADGSLHGSFGNRAIDDAIAQHAPIFLASKHDTRTFFGRAFAPELNEIAETQFLFELIQPEQRVVICGAGHVGASLARLAALLGYRATLIDDRKEFLKRADFPDRDIDLIIAESWSSAVTAATG